MQNRNSTHSNPAGFGKIPPQACDVEEIILGAIFLEKECWHLVSGILTIDMFYKDAHQKMYAAADDLYNSGAPIDIATITHKLKEKGQLEDVGGPFAITSMTNRVASAANIEYHAHIVKQHWIKREIIRLSANAMQKAFDDSTDSFELMAETQSIIDKVMYQMDGKRMMSVQDLALATKIDIIGRSSRKEQLGMSTGFPDLDHASLGLVKGDLIIVAARPGMGKTAFAVQIAKNVGADRQKIIAVFSLEMKATQLVTRLIAGDTEINSKSMMRGSLEHEEMVKVENSKMNYPNIIIDDTSGINIRQLRSRVMKIKAIHKHIDLIVVDYLQLMSGMGKARAEYREGEISEISRGLKQIAKDFDIPVIALSQLSREVEKRGNKRPQLSDLRESGAIEQDADVVWFLFRPDYYKDTHDTTDSHGNDLSGLCKVIIAKSRNGSLEDVKLRFIDKYVKFENYNEPEKASNQLQMEQF